MVKVPDSPVPGTLAALAGTAEGTSAAILHRGELQVRRREGKAQHAVHLLPLLDELLSDLGLPRSALEAVAFTRGPGPFTGGRIVVASAQGLGLGLGIPLIPVSSLAATAWAAGRDHCAVALDAGRGEVYWGMFRRTPTGVETVGAEQVAAPEALDLPDGQPGPWWGAGSGWGTVGKTLAQRLGARLAGSNESVRGEADAAAALAVGPWHAGAILAPDQAVPTYLRASYAEKPAG